MKENRGLYLLLGLAFVYLSPAGGAAGDEDALLALKAATDATNALPWRAGGGAAVCSWVGVKQCSRDGRVTKLVLEFFNLTGQLPSDALSSLDQLRVLSFKSNFLFGEIPDLSAMTDLKSLYLNNNQFSGRIPPSLAALHRLKIIVLSRNSITGEIPSSLAKLGRLYALLLQDNLLSGEIPPFEQAGLRLFNVSGNHLSGEIPRTGALRKFDPSSFSANPNLCGEQAERKCTSNGEEPVSPSEGPVASVVVSSSYSPPSREKKMSGKRVAAIAASSAGGFLFVAVLTGLAAAFFLAPWRKTAAAGGAGSKSAEPAEPAGGGESAGDGKSSEGFSWEAGRVGNLVFCGGDSEAYSLEELLKASAETLGRGTVGSTYKAIMESGFVVTVKRLKDSSRPIEEEFRRRIEALGRLRHPNLVPLRAYFMAREERLLVFDYFPNGSLFALIHGSRPGGGGKPLHWTSCLKIAEDVATGLLYLHQNGVVHGNLKSSNVILGPDFESCLADYGLVPHLSSSDFAGEGATEKADLYSFGILLLELLTGKTPSQGPAEGVEAWVRSVREQEADSGYDPASGSDNSEKLGALVAVAASCVAPAPESRPSSDEVVRMIREARVEILASSNSGDHSPGRWSDGVHSLPRRECASDRLNFAARD
ncbi:inactive leucine-rich repeat receptor-like serine/threonine-protein kinase At1g60630 [Wolffia australiana]